MKVSVIILTYNQEEFIAQAIRSALQQETDFAYEIIVGEDASTDRTRAIVAELQQLHPDKIRVLWRNAEVAQRERAVGVAGKGNFVDCLRTSTAKYVALLDGDDYWTTPHKLQKQVDFLESHSEYAFCFHNATIVREGESPDSAKSFCPPNQKQTSTLEDLLKGNFIFSGSTIFRRGLFGPWPDWFHTAETGDWLLHVFNAQYGKIGYLDEVMAVYRVHAGSSWSGRPARARLIDQVNLLDRINAHLGYKYNKTIKATQRGDCAVLAEMAYRTGDTSEARKFLTKCVRLDISNYRFPTSQHIRRLLKLNNPALFNLVKSLRDFLFSRRSSANR